MGVWRDCPQSFFKYPLLSQEQVKQASKLHLLNACQATNFEFYTHIHKINRNKSPLTISGKVAVGVARDSRNVSGHPYVGRIARSSLR